mgnify:CR=1 FL=1
MSFVFYVSIVIFHPFQPLHVELLEDLISTDKLDAVADDIQVKSALVSAISIASKFA